MLLKDNMQRTLPVFNSTARRVSGNSAMLINSAMLLLCSFNAPSLFFCNLITELGTHANKRIIQCKQSFTNWENNFLDPYCHRNGVL